MTYDNDVNSVAFGLDGRYWLQSVGMKRVKLVCKRISPNLVLRSP